MALSTQQHKLKHLYQSDESLWLTEMVKLLRENRLAELDIEHLIEELEALGRSEKSAVKSLLLQIIVHLLLYHFWQQERERNGNHWMGEIITFRVQLEDRLTTNLKNYLLDNLDKIYDNARLIVERKAQLNNLPLSCPYSFTDLLEKEWFPILNE
ncbi:MAG: DUF29 domain-containing protein [Microcystaceae cyanobacterium]